MLISCSGSPSGGTLATILQFLDSFTLKQISASLAPYALSPVPGPSTRSSTSWLTALLGITSVSDLGLLTTSVAASTDRPQVHRSWGLIGSGNVYGPNFQFNEYMKTRNYLTGVLLHIGLTIAMLLLTLKPVRWLLEKMVYAPGEGAEKEQTKKESLEYRAIANADVEGVPIPRAFGRVRYEGGLYYRMHTEPSL